jgi:hypothetical protein
VGYLQLPISGARPLVFRCLGQLGLRNLNHASSLAALSQVCAESRLCPTGTILSKPVLGYACLNSTHYRPKSCVLYQGGAGQDASRRSRRIVEGKPQRVIKQDALSRQHQERGLTRRSLGATYAFPLLCMMAHEAGDQRSWR